MPAPDYVFKITCPRCDGFDFECDLCSGRGEAPFFRCPGSQRTPELDLAFRCYMHTEAGLYPVAGGLLDQSASFIEFEGIVNSERNAIDERRRKHDEALAEMQARAKLPRGAQP